MGTFTPQMEAYVRQQLHLEREPWWIATELARMGGMDQSTARTFVDQFADEVRPRLAWGYVPTILAGICALGLGLFLLWYGVLIFAWLLIPVGTALATGGGYAWRRLHRRGSK